MGKSRKQSRSVSRSEQAGTKRTRRWRRYRWAAIAGFCVGLLWVFMNAVYQRSPHDSSIEFMGLAGYAVFLLSSILGVFAFIHLRWAFQEKGWVVWMARGAWLIPFWSWIWIIALATSGSLSKWRWPI